MNLILKSEKMLISTHSKLCIPIIDRIYRKMIAGIKFGEIKVATNLICDGHHRYLASLLASYPLEMIPAIITAATSAVDWKLVSFEEDDWDTDAKIRMLNEYDAEYNNIPLEEINELIKKV